MSIIRRKNGEYAPSAYTMSAANDDPTTLRITIEEKAVRGKPMFSPLHVANLVVRFDKKICGPIGPNGGAICIETPVIMERDNGQTRAPLWGGLAKKKAALTESEKWQAKSILGGGLVLIRTQL